MYRPSDVAFDTTNKKVYVVEHFNHRISKWNYDPAATPPANFVFTLDAGQVTTLSLDVPGTGYVAPTLVFSAPDLDIANPVTATGTITETAGVLNAPTLTDGGNGYSVAPTVTVVDSAGINGVVTVSAITTAWGSNVDGTTGKSFPIGDGGTTDVGLHRPSGIVFDSANNLLYVTDTFHHRVRIITADTGLFPTVSSVGSSGSGIPNFYRPAGIAINVAGTFVVIADELNHRAVRYATNGTTLINPAVLDNPADTTGLSFVRPHGVVFDVTDTSFNIGDSQRGLISRYDDGSTTFVDQFGTPGRTGRVPAANGTELFFPASGKGLLNGTSTTVFADTRNNNLKRLNGTVIEITTADVTTPNAGTVGTGDGQLYYPELASAFVDTANYVLAANTLNNRVEVYSSSTNVLTSRTNFGSP